MAKKETTVDPLPGLAPWVGGKRNLASRLVARIEKVPHSCYAEPFLGMGGVFFRRSAPLTAGGGRGASTPRTARRRLA